MRRYVVPVLIALALAVGLVFVVHGAAWLWHWFEIHSGTARGGPDPYYNFWSGIGSDLGEVTLITAILTPAVIAARHRNCATRGCWRLTQHTVTDDKGVEYRRCHRHHPSIPDEHSHHGLFHNHMSDEHLAAVDAHHVATNHPTTETGAPPT